MTRITAIEIAFSLLILTSLAQCQEHYGFAAKDIHEKIQELEKEIAGDTRDSWAGKYAATLFDEVADLWIGPANGYVFMYTTNSGIQEISCGSIIDNDGALQMVSENAFSFPGVISNSLILVSTRDFDFVIPIGRVHGAILDLKNGANPSLLGFLKRERKKQEAHNEPYVKDTYSPFLTLNELSVKVLDTAPQISRISGGKKIIKQEVVLSKGKRDGVIGGMDLSFSADKTRFVTISRVFQTISIGVVSSEDDLRSQVMPICAGDVFITSR
jgi:hypothetical protein